MYYYLVDESSFRYLNNSIRIFVKFCDLNMEMEILSRTSLPFNFQLIMELM